MSALRGWVRGVGLWSTTAESFEAWVAGGMRSDLGGDSQPSRPPASLLHPRLRRRTSTLTRAAVTASQAALEQGGGDIGSARFVLVSSYGEIETTVALLDALADPEGLVSPTKFHNSVHNTATGYLSIAAGNRTRSTALAAGPHALEVGLLEILAGFDSEPDGPDDAVLILGEERLPAPLDRADADPTHVVALHVARRPADESHPSSLDRTIALARGPWRDGQQQEPDDDRLQSIVAGAVPLLRALATDERAGSGIPLLTRRRPGVESAWFAHLYGRDGGRDGSSEA